MVDPMPSSLSPSVLMSDAIKGQGHGTGDTGVQAEAMKQFLSGKRLLALGDIDGAIDHLEITVQLMVATFGETADEMAEPYFEYGCALLQACRRDSAVFGNTGGQGAEGDDDDEAVDDDDEAGPSAAPGPSTSDVPGPSTASASELPGPSNGPAPVPAAEESAEDPLDDDENVDNFQVAWETLELARHILLRNPTASNELRIAEIHNLLGEQNLETDKNEAALEEFTQALKIRQRLTEQNSRLVAESLYNVALAHKYCQDYTSARTFAIQATDIIRKRVDNIQDKEGIANSKELDGLKALLPEMEQEVKELEKCEAETKQVKQALMSVVSAIKGSVAPGPKINDGPAASASKASTTTIGFGAPPQSTTTIGFGAPPQSTTTIGFGAPQSTTTIGFGAPSKSATTAAAPVNNLVVKRRKPKTDDAAAQAATVDDSTSGADAGVKRIKL